MGVWGRPQGWEQLRKLHFNEYGRNHKDLEVPETESSFRIGISLSYLALFRGFLASSTPKTSQLYPELSKQSSVIHPWPQGRAQMSMGTLGTKYKGRY